MNRKSFILTALASAKGDVHTPVQLQKLLFLLDENIAKSLGGPFFNFEPYDYGPFDKEVYDELYGLEISGDAEILSGKWNNYRLSEAGQSKGEELLNELESSQKEYFEKISKYVRNLSFSQLVSAIYKNYPEMKINSVFKN